MVWDGLIAAAQQDPSGVGTVLSIPLPISAARLSQKPSVQAELAWVIEIESTWIPSIQNKDSGASGLIQFTKESAKKVGTTVEAIRKMSRAEQAPYIAKYFAMAAEGHKCTEIGDLYVLVAAPSALLREDYHIIYPVGSKAWMQNPGWREPNNGPITAGSIRRKGRPPGELPDNLGAGGLPPPPPNVKPPPVPVVPGQGDLGELLLFGAILWGVEKARKARRKNVRRRIRRQ